MDEDPRVTSGSCLDMHNKTALRPAGCSGNLLDRSSIAPFDQVRAGTWPSEKDPAVTAAALASSPSA